MLTAWQMSRTRRSSDLLALQKFHEEASKRESALTEAKSTGEEAWRHAFIEFLNFLEVYACAYNNRLIIGRGSKDIIRHKLEDCFIEVEAAKDLHPHIAAAVDRATTFAELKKLIRDHRNEVDLRRGERARFVEQPIAT